MAEFVYALLAALMVAFVALPLVLVAWGRRLPADHEASRSVYVAAKPAAVFALLTDVRAIPRWRKTVRSVARIDESRFRERSGQGTLELEIEERIAPSKLVLRTSPTRSMVFTGSWTYELVAEDDGTRVTLTERGHVQSPIARLFAAYMLGHATHVERTVAALAAHFGARGH
jgi:uncharacterized protein YndB with AHSA1/START domain